MYVGEVMNRVEDSEPRPARLPDAELEVMACIWHRGEATARQVREALAEFRPMTHGAAVTLLRRLEAKGWVTRSKAPVGKAFVYRPARRPGPTKRRVLRDLVRRVFAGSGVALVSSLFDEKPPTAAELDELERMLEDLRRKADRREEPP